MQNNFADAIKCTRLVLHSHILSSQHLDSKCTEFSFSKSDLLLFLNLCVFSREEMWYFIPSAWIPMKFSISSHFHVYFFVRLSLSLQCVCFVVSVVMLLLLLLVFFMSASLWFIGITNTIVWMHFHRSLAPHFSYIHRVKLLWMLLARWNVARPQIHRATERCLRFTDDNKIHNKCKSVVQRIMPI